MPNGSRTDSTLKSRRPTPQRVPPTQIQDSSPESGPAHPSPAGAPLPDNVTIDAQALQAQLDRLAQQFDWLKTQLRQSQKLATLGTSAAMIAHELNNLLTPIMAYSQEALKGDDVELMRLALTKTVDRASAMRDMVARVIGLARTPDTVIKAVQVKTLIEEAIACLGRDLGKDNIHVQLQIDGALAVRGNANQLMQVFFNLVTNARQAMVGRRGRLVVDAALTEGRQIAIHIRDNGCGIAPEHLDEIFDPYFSTRKNADKPDQRGLGLGLAICRDIIEEFGGQIAVASELGKGTTFTVTLPAAD